MSVVQSPPRPISITTSPMPLSWKIHVASSSSVAPWPARVSVPLPRGTTPAGFSITRPDGSTSPAQSRALTRWPDGTPRWVQLDFQTSQAGGHVAHPVAAEGTPALPVEARREGDKFQIRVGRLRFSLDPNSSSPIATVAWSGRDLGASSRFEALTLAGEVQGIATGAARDIQVEAEGPHRFQISWETRHEPRGLDARFRVEALAGVEGFTLSYQFFHKVPKHDTLTFRSLRAEFPFTALEGGHSLVMQSCHGNIGLRRFVRPNHPVTMHVDGARYSAHVKASAELDDDFDYPPFLRDVNLDTGTAVALEGRDAAVIFTMHDFELQRPKTLTVRAGRVEAGIWPVEAGTLVVPQGRSKRQVFAFRFCDPDPKATESWIANPAACRIEPALCWLDKADSVHAGASWDQPRLFDGSEPGAAWFSHILQIATGMWESVPEMFDYGDTVDTGYTLAYPSTGRVPMKTPRFHFAATTRMAHSHFHTFDHLPPVWSNNEYDAIYCLAQEAIRVRDAGAFKKMCAAARHQLEVDFVHYSDHWQQHRSTPQHSYDHTTLMSSIPSHQWTQGLYYYFALTGDDDVPEVVRAICDFDLSFLERDEVSFGLYFNRELGWALVALVFGWEMTADKRYLEMSRKIIRKLEKDAGRTDFTDAKSAVAGMIGLNATGLGGGFNVNTIPLGVKVYHQATGEEWAEKLLHDWVAFGMKNFNDRSTGVKFTELFPETFCYVCERTGETRWLEESLWQLRLFLIGSNSLGWLDSRNRALTTKEYTRVYRGLSHYLSALARMGMLAKLEKELM